MRLHSTVEPQKDHSGTVQEAQPPVPDPTAAAARLVKPVPLKLNNVNAEQQKDAAAADLKTPALCPVLTAARHMYHGKK